MSDRKSCLEEIGIFFVRFWFLDFCSEGVFLEEDIFWGADGGHA